MLRWSTAPTSSNSRIQRGAGQSARRGRAIFLGMSALNVLRLVGGSTGEIDESVAQQAIQVLAFELLLHAYKWDACGKFLPLPPPRPRDKVNSIERHRPRAAFYSWQPHYPYFLVLLFLHPSFSMLFHQGPASQSDGWIDFFHSWQSQCPHCLVFFLSIHLFFEPSH